MQKKEKTITQLCQFGISKKEANIYIALLELGPSTVQEVAKHLKMNRSTTHVLCESLKEKGFLGQTRNRGKRLLFAEEKEKFRKMVEDEKSHLLLKEMTLDGLLPALEMIEPGQKDKPKVRFYEGQRGFLDVCQRSLDKAKDEILFLGSRTDFHKVASLEYNRNHYVPTRLERSIKIKMLIFKNPSAIELQKNDEKEMRETRFLPNNYKFNSTVLVYGNEFAMITSTAPFLGVVIESKELTDFIAKTFHMLWHHAAPFKR